MLEKVKETVAEALEQTSVLSQRRLPSRISEQIPWICLKWSCPSRTPAAWKSTEDLETMITVGDVAGIWSSTSEDREEESVIDAEVTKLLGD